MFAFIGRCMQMSIASMIMCRNETNLYTTIIDSVHNIKSGEYIHATLEQPDARFRKYNIGILFSRSFKKDMSVPGRRLNTMIRSNVLTLRIAYTDSEPASTPEELHDGFWNDTRKRSVSSIFHESSYGKAPFDEETSVVATVHLNASIESTHTGGCDIEPMFELAVPAVTEAGIDFSDFTHIQYILPPNYGSTCNWEGLSLTACSIPGEYIFENCFSVLRNATVFARAHELGHNFGMFHAAGCGLAQGECLSLSSTPYGDATAIMGGAHNGDQTGGFIAPNRINMGWMDNITDGSLDGTYEISALSEWPSPENAAIRIPIACPVSAQMGNACEIIVSYRTPTRIDSAIADIFDYTISVHLKSATELGITLLLISLRLGDSYQLPNGKVLFVCETYTDGATIVLGKDGDFKAVCDAAATDSTAIIIGVVAAVFVSLFGGMACTYAYRARK